MHYTSILRLRRRRRAKDCAKRMPILAAGARRHNALEHRWVALDFIQIGRRLILIASVTFNSVWRVAAKHVACASKRAQLKALRMLISKALTFAPPSCIGWRSLCATDRNLCVYFNLAGGTAERRERPRTPDVPGIRNEMGKFDG